MDVVAIAKTVIEGAQENMFSYVLWWTFWYGIVHGEFERARGSCILAIRVLATSGLAALGDRPEKTETER